MIFMSQLRRWTATLLIVFVWSAPGVANQTGPTKELMDRALAALSRIVDRDIAEEDQAWLRERWAENGTSQSEVYVDWLESMAFAEKLTDDNIDPLALARMRIRIIDQLYCDSKRTTDPHTHRSRSIVAPPEMVLAEDCLVGAVVTPFDVRALAESNARIGEIVGSPVDVAAVEAEVRDILPDGLAEIDPEGQRRLLWGEMRAKALETYLASASEETRNQFIATAREIFAENNHVAATTLEMEKKALQQVAHVAAIARKDAYWFNPQEASTILSFLEHVTGAGFSPGERLELVGMYAEDFREDPENITKFAANLRYWLDKGRYFGKDDTGKIRSWTSEEKINTRHREAAIQYCAALSSGTDKNKRFIEILFAHDPVTDADCEAKTLTRESDRVLAEDGDYQFTRGALDAHRRAFEIVFAFRLTDEERTWFDEAATTDVSAGRIGLSQGIDGFQRIVADIQKDSKTGPHMNEQWREGYSVGVTCANKDDDNANVRRLLAIIDGHDPVIHMDCERESVIRQSDVDGRVGTLNFLAAIGGRAPMSETERENLLGGIASYFESDHTGALNYRSEWVKFNHWWSRMPQEVRRKRAEEIRQEVSSLQDLFDTRAKLSSKATLNLGLMSLCDLQMAKLQYNTKMIDITNPTIFNTNPYADSAIVNPQAPFEALRFYNVMAPFVQQQCERAWR